MCVWGAYSFTFFKNSDLKLLRINSVFFMAIFRVIIILYNIAVSKLDIFRWSGGLVFFLAFHFLNSSPLFFFRPLIA